MKHLWRKEERRDLYYMAWRGDWGGEIPVIIVIHRG
jgi:hypothetical protein